MGMVLTQELQYKEKTKLGLAPVSNWGNRNCSHSYNTFNGPHNITNEVQCILICICLEKNSKGPFAKHLIGFLKLSAVNRVFLPFHYFSIQLSCAGRPQLNQRKILL